MLRRLGRTVLLIALVAAGTLTLVRYAPGYFADTREMDAQYAGSVRAEMGARLIADRSAAAMAGTIAAGWLRGDFGVSRQYRVPVGELIRPRLFVTLRLLGESLMLGWLAAMAAALLLSGQKRGGGEAWVASGSALLLAIPIGALSTIFLLTDTGGPALAVGVLLAARDFKFLYRLLRRQWQEPSLLFARSQGIPLRGLVVAYLLRPVWPQIASIASMSFVVALSMAVPAEVLFDVPGVGRLAWGAAMNRDLPLLLAITLLMAMAVASAGLLSEPLRIADSSMEAA